MHKTLPRRERERESDRQSDRLSRDNSEESLSAFSETVLFRPGERESIDDSRRKKTTEKNQSHSEETILDTTKIRIKTFQRDVSAIEDHKSQGKTATLKGALLSRRSQRGSQRDFRRDFRRDPRRKETREKTLKTTRFKSIEGTLKGDMVKGIH
jgi:hypothetical protein